MKRALLVAAALTLAVSASAYAQPRRGRVFVPRVHAFAAPLFYDPFWPPYYAPWVYPYAPRPASEVRVQVVPKQAEVFVDGYYAGLASDVGHLRTMPGGHAITLYLEGYRTMTENVYVRPGSTFKLRETMAPLAPGEASAPPPLPVKGANGETGKTR